MNPPDTWFTRYLDQKFEGIDNRFDDLEKKVELHIPICGLRFDRLEQRVGAPSRWMKSKLKELIDESTKQVIRWGTVIVLTFMAYHFFP